MNNRKKILVVSPVPTHPPISGNRSRILSLLETINALGHDVYFLHVQQDRGDEKAMRGRWGDRYYCCEYTRPTNPVLNFLKRVYRKLGSQRTYTYGLDQWYDGRLDRCIQDLKSRINFNVVIVEYVFFSKALKNFGADTLKVIDTHDVFADRHKHYLKQGQNPTWYSTSKRAESRGLARADVVFAIQEEERSYFSTFCRKKVVVVGHNLTPIIHSSLDVVPHSVLFIASNNKINLQAAEFLINQVMPRVKEIFPLANFVIAGTVCGQLPELPEVKKLGAVDDLAQAYKTAAVVVNPVLIGTGLKIKTMEALAHGKPLVTTSVGAQGLEKYADKAFLIADGPEMFAQSVVRFLSDKKLVDRVCAEGHAVIEDCNQKNIETIQAVIN